MVCRRYGKLTIQFQCHGHSHGHTHMKEHRPCSARFRVSTAGHRVSERRGGRGPSAWRLFREAVTPRYCTQIAGILKGQARTVFSLLLALPSADVQHRRPPSMRLSLWLFVVFPIYFTTRVKLTNQKVQWPNGKALGYEPRDCRFDPCLDHFLSCFVFLPLLFVLTAMLLFFSSNVSFFLSSFLAFYFLLLMSSSFFLPLWLPVYAPSFITAAFVHCRSSADSSIM